MKTFKSRVINRIASTTFGVYLIYVNGLLKIFIWHRLLKCDSFVYFRLYPLYLVLSILVLSILAVFIACSLIDFLIRMPIEKLLCWLKK